MLGRLARILVLVLVAGCALPTTSPSAPAAASTLSRTATGPTGTVTAADLGLGEPLDPSLGNPGYDAGHYDLELSFDPHSRRLDALVTLRATATARLETVNLDFIGFEVTAVTVDGAPVSFARTERDLTLKPKPAIEAGRAFAVGVRYAGVPRPWRSASGAPTALGWNEGPGGVNYVVSEPDGARAWFPCNDHPSDKATFTTAVTVPNDVSAASNGVLESRAAAGPDHTRWTWQMDAPMATYLATVVIGDYELREDAARSASAGVRVRDFLARDSSRVPEPTGGDPAADGLSLEGEMIAFYSGLLGPYPFKAAGVAIVPGMRGALETQTLVVSGTASDQIVAHELSHQWLGDHVSVARWSDIWLNEGFATYMQLLWIDHRGQRTMAEMAAVAYDAMHGRRAPGDPSSNDLFAQSVYYRGALVLYALRERIGDDAFWATLRAWVGRYGGRSATTRDFVALAEETSGLQLDDLFDAWLYSKDMPPLPGPTPSPQPTPSTDASQTVDSSASGS